MTATQDDTKPLNVRLDPELRAALDRFAEQKGAKASELVRDALRRFLPAPVVVGEDGDEHVTFGTVLRWTFPASAKAGGERRANAEIMKNRAADALLEVGAASVYTTDLWVETTVTPQGRIVNPDLSSAPEPLMFEMVVEAVQTDRRFGARISSSEPVEGHLSPVRLVRFAAMSPALAVLVGESANGKFPDSVESEVTPTLDFPGFDRLRPSELGQGHTHYLPITRLDGAWCYLLFQRSNTGIYLVDAHEIPEEYISPDGRCSGEVALEGYLPSWVVTYAGSTASPMMTAGPYKLGHVGRTAGPVLMDD